MTYAGNPLGLSHDKAQLFGLPHIGCEYVNDSGGYRVLDGEFCVVCGRPGTTYPLNAHHIVPRSVARSMRVGRHSVRSPLFATCGSGTTGCHNGFHGGARYVVRWEWDRPEFEDAWWAGHLLDLHGPHSDEMFRYGHYAIHDKDRDVDILLRGGT